MASDMSIKIQLSKKKNSLIDDTYEWISTYSMYVSIMYISKHICMQNKE